MENNLWQEVIELRSGSDLSPNERGRLSGISGLSSRIDSEVAQNLLQEFRDALGELVACDFSAKAEMTVSHVGKRLVSFFKKNVA